MVSLRYSSAETQRRSTWSGAIGRPPSTMPPYAALSAMVSTIVRPSSSMCELRISRAGVTYSVARSTSKTVQRGPSSGAESTKASSTSIRTLEKASNGMVEPFSQTVSSNITP